MRKAILLAKLEKKVINDALRERKEELEKLNAETHADLNKPD